MSKPLPIKQRIRAAYTRGIGYAELMRAVFPEAQFPRAWRYGSNGGPPGCAMAFGKALREMKAEFYWPKGAKMYNSSSSILLPPE